MWKRTAVFVAALALVGSTLAHGQEGRTAKPADPTLSSEPAPASLELTPSQRQVLFTSISSKTHRSTAAPPNVLPKLGDVVPPSVEVAPIPDAVLELSPKLRGYACAMVADQVLILDGTSHRIVEIVSAGKDAAPAAPRV
jgi:hypothetical protein